MEGIIMKKEIINAKNAPAAVGPYSHAVKMGDILMTSGQLGLIPETGELPEGVEAQAEQALKNLQAVLAAGGCTMADVVKTVVFLADMNDFAKVNAIYAKYFTSEEPARSCVQVAKLPKGGLVEMEAVAICH
jgi:2-iminobutanoate/2-iminopropanoate deaminase